METEEKEMFFFIADISGYTAFMLKNQTDYAHGTLVIMQLMECLIKKVSLPLEISKLEGDAIFFYLTKEHMPKEFKANPLLFGKKIIELFTVFSHKLQELISSTPCKCGGCSNIHQLNLKIISHYGKAAMTKIGGFQELSGVDVIIPHRLLKNNIKEKRYLLMTEPVYHQIHLPSDGKIAESTEQDKDLGTIHVFVYYPQVEEMVIEKKKLSPLENLRGHVKFMMATLLIKLGLKKILPFHNLPKQNDK